MITLYRKTDCALCDEIAEALKEIVIAHVVVDVEKLNDRTNKNIPKIIPCIEDEGKIISGGENLFAYVKELTNLMKEWGKFQSDSCYIDRDGSTC
ncbi:MAG: glutaredoxin family protein [Ignavibacteriales bacterium]|nr:glutaredoxin family protein [Ignavibacteriales bacterium]